MPKIYIVANINVIDPDGYERYKGAFYTGVLTCVQLRDRQLRFIAASAATHLKVLALTHGTRLRHNTQCGGRREDRRLSPVLP